MDSGESYDVEYVEYLIDKGADLELTATGLESPLDAMARNEDMAKALIGLVERKRPLLLRKHADSMLRHAVESGSLETVKVRNHFRYLYIIGSFDATRPFLSLI